MENSFVKSTDRRIKLKNQFQKLTPKEVENLVAYEDALDYGLEEDDIYNIAVTGGYGTGKSSVIESFKRKLDKSYSPYSSKDLLNISLAHFSDDSSESRATEKYEGKDTREEKPKKDETDTRAEKQFIDLNIIEKKIVNQLIHQIDPKKIPQSIFRVKEKIPMWKIVAYTVYILIFIILLGSSIFAEESISIFNINFSRNPLLLGTLMYSSFGIYKIVNYQANKRMLKTVSIYGNELKIDEEVTTTYFDKFINDVIYLFLNSEKKVFVFEDLDRFNESRIFEKLHEVNTLLNKRLNSFSNENSNVSKEKITFVYLIRDDVFESKERTKLFDLIIPIVPVIIPANSYDKFVQLIREKELSLEFNQQTLKKIFIYIDDMRLMKNIINEYLVYKSRLNTNLNNEKLLCLIIYKNVFPKDFSQFQYGQSFIDLVLSQKNILIEEFVKNFKEELENINVLIEEAKQETLNNINELEALYFMPEEFTHITVNGKKETDFKNKADFISIVKNNNYKVDITSIGINGYRRNNENINIENKFKDMYKNEEFNKRKRAIESKIKIKEIYNKRKRLLSEIEEVEKKEFNELVENKSKAYFMDFLENNIESHFKYLEKNNYFSLIIFLLREGLIDEKSSDYLTYFYDMSISKQDRDFLRKLYDRTKIDYNYRVENPKRLLLDISPSDFERYNIKNLDLGKYILENKEKVYITHLLKNIDKNSLGFYLYNLFDNLNSSKKYLLECLIKQDIDFLQIIKDETKLSDYDRDFFYLYSITILDKESLIILEEQYELVNYINNIDLSNEELETENILKILDTIEKSKIKFKHMPNNSNKQEFVLSIIEYDLFEINRKNLESILECLESDYRDEEFVSSNISLFSKLENKPLKNNIFNLNLNIYLRLYIEFGAEELNDDMYDLVLILNNSQLDEELGKKYLSKLNSMKAIKNLKDVSNKYWDNIIKNNNYEINLDNLILIFNFQEEIPDDIIDFLNEESSDLSFELSKENKFKQEEIETTFNHLIKIQKLDIGKNQNIITSFGEKVKDLDDFELTSEEIKYLLDNDVIELTENNLDIILGKYREGFKDSYKSDEIVKSMNKSQLTAILKNDYFSFEKREKWFIINIRKLELVDVLTFIKNNDLTHDLIYVLKKRPKYVEYNRVNLAIAEYYNGKELIARGEVMKEDNLIYLSGRDLSINQDYKGIDLDEFIN